MRHDLREWEEAEQHVVPYRREQVERFCPNTKAILEVRHPKDLEILEKIYANSVLLGDQSEEGWGIKYTREFDMTNDSTLFKSRTWWEERGYKPDEYGRWIGPEGDMALPLYQGVMIWLFNSAASDYVQGANNRAQWEKRTGYRSTLPSAQYLMSTKTVNVESPASLSYRIGYRSIQNATNQRTLIATIIPACPCGNSVAILRSMKILNDMVLLSFLCSFPLDAILRSKMSQNNINAFYIEELPVPNIIKENSNNSVLSKIILRYVLSLACREPLYSPLWFRLSTSLGIDTCMFEWLRRPITYHEFIRRRVILDAIIPILFGLEEEDIFWILRDCDYPAETMCEKAFARTLNPKGFWRVDKDKDPELRHTVLTLVAFHDLKDTIAAYSNDRDKGIEAFCNQNSGEGWMLPETLCLADYGIGHDDRAKAPQLVRSRMGERFLPWQLEQSMEESWAECERHARNILGDDGFKRVLTEIKSGGTGEYTSEMKPVFLKAAEEPGYAYDKEDKDSAQGKLFRTKPVQETLFGDDKPDSPLKKRT